MYNPVGFSTKSMTQMVTSDKPVIPLVKHTITDEDIGLLKVMLCSPAEFWVFEMSN